MSSFTSEPPAGVQSPMRPMHKTPSLSKKRLAYHRRNGHKSSDNPRAFRRRILQDELALYGLALREDSKLCQRFIGGEQLSIHFIATVLHEMDYLNKKTAYPQLMDILVGEHRKACYPLDTHQLEADVYAKLSVQAKHLALSENNCGIIEHCVPGYCVADDIGSNQIVLASLSEQERHTLPMVV